MFPNGVVYEGVSDEPVHFRGESGANDSMVKRINGQVCSFTCILTAAADSPMRQLVANIDAADAAHKNLEGFPKLPPSESP